MSKLTDDYYYACLILQKSSNLQISMTYQGGCMLTPDQVNTCFPIHQIVIFSNGLEVRRKAAYPMTNHRPTPRKGVYEMSKKSKMQLWHLVANCEVKFSSMLTLTWGDFFFPTEGREAKRQLELILNSFRKRFELRYIWFTEFTQKGRPHFHVLTTVKPNDFDRHWLGQEWSRISVLNYCKRLQKYPEKYDLKIPIGQCEEFAMWEQEKSYKVHSHKKCWEDIRLEDGAMRYVFKYAQKETQKTVPIGFSNIGRFWGNSAGLKPEEIATLTVGKDVSLEEVQNMVKGHRVGELPLIPKFILEKDALNYFRVDGKKLSEVIEVCGVKHTSQLP